MKKGLVIWIIIAILIIVFYSNSGEEQNIDNCSYYEKQLNLEYNDWNYFLELLNQEKIEIIYSI